MQADVILEYHNNILKRDPLLRLPIEEKQMKPLISFNKPKINRKKINN